MSSRPWSVTRFQTLFSASDLPPWPKGTPSGSVTVQIFAFIARNASERRRMFSSERSGTTSTSTVTYGEPWITAANPPTTTYRTPWSRRTDNIRSGASSGSGTGLLERSTTRPREAERCLVLADAGVKIERQVCERSMPVGVVRWRDRGDEVEIAGSNKVDDPLERRGGGPDLDSRDLRLAQADPGCQLTLGQPCSPPCLQHELSPRHRLPPARCMYRILRCLE